MTVMSLIKAYTETDKLRSLSRVKDIEKIFGLGLSVEAHGLNYITARVEAIDR